MRRDRRLCRLMPRDSRRTPIKWRAEDLPTPDVHRRARPRQLSVSRRLREYIDWSPFFHTWGLKGIYPRILEDERQGVEAGKIFADGNAFCLTASIAENLDCCAWSLRIFSCQRRRRRCRALYTDCACQRAWWTRFHFLQPAGEPRRQRAVPLARRLYRAKGGRAVAITSVPSP